MTDEIFSNCGFRKLAVEMSEGNWPEYLDRITNLLAIPPRNQNDAHVDRWASFTGTYRARSWLGRKVDPIIVAADRQGLYLASSPPMRLLHKTGDTFCIQCLYVELTFKSGEILCTGDFPRMPKVWKKVL